MNAIRCFVIAAAAFGLLTGAAGAAGKLAFKADPDSYQEVSALSTTGTGSFKLLLNGYIPELAYERGNLPTDAPFEEVMQRYAISAKAREEGAGPRYSESIREGIELIPRSPGEL